MKTIIAVVEVPTCEMVYLSNMFHDTLDKKKNEIDPYAVQNQLLANTKVIWRMLTTACNCTDSQKP
jgi:hypothetical protein